MGTYNYVKDTVDTLLTNKYKVPPNILESNRFCKKSLFSISKIFTERELVMLFFDLEREFRINLDASLLISDYDFSTIDGIVSYIVNSLKGGEKNEKISKANAFTG